MHSLPEDKAYVYVCMGFTFGQSPFCSNKPLNGWTSDNFGLCCLLEMDVDLHWTKGPINWDFKIKLIIFVYVLMFLKHMYKALIVKLILLYIKREVTLVIFAEVALI